MAKRKGDLSRSASQAILLVLTGPQFGSWFHTSLDAFSGYNNWLKVWWTSLIIRNGIGSPIRKQSYDMR